MKPSIWKSSTPRRLPLCMIVFVLLMSGCAIEKRNASVRTTTASTRTNTLRQDSTYHRDSIFVREYTRGDTVYLDRWRDRWRERTLTRTDTVYQDREVQIQIPPERYVPRFYTYGTMVGVLAVIWLIVRMVLKIRKRLL